MHPQRELSHLAALKTTLRREIARRRVQCVGAAARVMQPWRLLERLVAFRRAVRRAQLAAEPPGSFLLRAVFPRHKVLGAFVRWGPLVFALLRSAGSPHKNR